MNSKRTEFDKKHKDCFRAETLPEYLRLLEIVAFPRKVPIPSLFQMIFPVRPQSKNFILSYECCRKSFHRFAFSKFFGILTAFLSTKSIPSVKIYCPADNSIPLPFPMASCELPKGTVILVVEFSNRLLLPSISLLCSFCFVIHCSGALFFNFFLRKVLLKAIYHFPDFYPLRRLR